MTAHARVRHDLLLRAANLANSLHDPRFGRDRLTAVAAAFALRTARAGAAHVARASIRPWSIADHVAASPASPASPRLTLGHDAGRLVLHRGAGLWSELVTARPWPTCAVCNAPVECATITQDVARCATIVAVACHGEHETMTISDELLEDRGHRDLVAFRGAARRAVNGS